MTSRMTSPPLLCLFLSYSFPCECRISSLPLCAFNQHPHTDSRSRRQPTHNRHAHQPFLTHLLIDQLPQTLRLQIAALELEQTIIIPPRLGVIPQLIIAQGEVVETFAAAFGTRAEDVG